MLIKLKCNSVTHKISLIKGSRLRLWNHPNWKEEMATEDACNALGSNPAEGCECLKVMRFWKDRKITSRVIKHGEKLRIPGITTHNSALTTLIKLKEIQRQYPDTWRITRKAAKHAGRAFMNFNDSAEILLESKHSLLATSATVTKQIFDKLTSYGYTVKTEEAPVSVQSKRYGKFVSVVTMVIAGIAELSGTFPAVYIAPVNLQSSTITLFPSRPVKWELGLKIGKKKRYPISVITDFVIMSLIENKLDAVVAKTENDRYQGAIALEKRIERIIPELRNRTNFTTSKAIDTILDKGSQAKRWTLELVADDNSTLLNLSTFISKKLLELESRGKKAVVRRSMIY